jgi:3-oxoacyl-[acyl-carrier-protein] synthase-1
MEHSFVVDQSDEPIYVAQASYIQEPKERTVRMAELLDVAVREASLPLVESELSKQLQSVPVFIGLPASSTQSSDIKQAITSKLVDILELHFNPHAISIHLIEEGNAAGLIAVSKATQQINQGNAHACIAGGVDSFIDPKLLEDLAEKGHLRSTENPIGYVPGEAAGCSLLASDELASRLAAIGCSRTIGQVTGVGTGMEPNSIRKKGVVCTGQGLAETIQQAIAGLPQGEVITRVYSDLNRETYRDQELGFALLKSSNKFSLPPNIIAPADCWGEVGAASGPLYIVLAIIAQLRGYAEGQHALVCCGSESGRRCAVLLNTALSASTETQARSQACQ